MYVECMRQPGHAVAGSRWYRTFQSTEMLRWLRGEFDDVPVDVPVRWLSGTQDPVLTPDLLDGYAAHISDFEVELVDGVGHWIVEQRPDLVLDRLRAFLKLVLAPIPKQCNGGMHGGLDHLAETVPVFDSERCQFMQAAQQDHCQWPGQWRQADLLEPRAAAQPDQQTGQQVHAATLVWPRCGGFHRRQLADPAPCDRRLGLDVADVGLDGLTNLGLPVRIWIDGGANVLAQLSDVGVQQLEKALLLAGELVVERAFRCAGVTNDVGHGGGAVAALAYRGGQAVEQSAAERVYIDGLDRSRVVSDGCCHVASLRENQPESALASTWY